MGAWGRSPSVLVFLFLSRIWLWGQGAVACGDRIASEASRTVVIVDAYSSGTLLAPVLREAGFRLVHARSDQKATARMLKGFRPKDFAVLIDAAGDLARTLASLEEERVHAVLAGNESGVSFAERLEQAMGIEGNEPSLNEARRDKYGMGEAVRRAGLRHIEQAIVASAGEAAAWIEGTLGGFSRAGSVIVKPRRGAGTDGVKRVRDQRELEEAFAELRAKPDIFGNPNDTLLVQRFVKGVEYAVNGVALTFAGRTYFRITDVWRYHKVAVEGASSVYGWDELVPPEELPDRLLGYTLEVLPALGIRKGPFHAEVMITEEGPVLVEAAARLYGAGNPAIAAETVEYGQLEAIADALARPHRFLAQAARPYAIRRHAVVVNISAPRPGLVMSHQALPALRERLGDALFQLLVFFEDGEPIPRTVDMATAIAQIEVRHGDREVVRRALDTVLEFEKAGHFWRESESARESRG